MSIELYFYIELSTYYYTTIYTLGRLNTKSAYYGLVVTYIILDPYIYLITFARSPISYTKYLNRIYLY